MVSRSDLRERIADTLALHFPMASNAKVLKVADALLPLNDAAVAEAVKPEREANERLQNAVKDLASRANAYVAQAIRDWSAKP